MCFTAPMSRYCLTLETGIHFDGFISKMLNTAISRTIFDITARQLPTVV